MLDPRTIETLLTEAAALQDWETVAVCERALTGIISVGTLKRLSPEACVTVQILELLIAGQADCVAPVPRKYVDLTELTQAQAVARLETKIGQRVDLEERDPAEVELCDATATVAVSDDVEIDVTDLSAPVVIHDLPPTPRMVRALSTVDLTELDDPDDDKTVVPS